MKKREFLDRLKAALMNRINSQAVVENVNYYEDYINTQVRMGMKEEVVIAKLGDPRLLAKTIIDSEKRKGNATEFGENQSSTNYGNYTSEESSYDTQPKKHMPVWAVLLIVFLVVFVVIGLVISLVFSIVSFFLPVLIPVLLVIFLVRLMRKV